MSRAVVGYYCQRDLLFFVEQRRGGREDARSREIRCGSRTRPSVGIGIHYVRSTLD